MSILTDVTSPLVALLRTDFAATPPSWPVNPPGVAAFDSRKVPSGRKRTKLAKILDAIHKKEGGPICFGIVNLEDAPAAGAAWDFAGWGLDRHITIGSTAKLWVMYAAFQLRNDLRTLIRNTPGVSRADLATKLKEAWTNSKVRELKRVAVSGQMPRLEQIFDLSALPATPPAGQPPDPATLAAAVDFQEFADCGIARGVGVSKATRTQANELQTFHQYEYVEDRALEIQMWETLAGMAFGRRLWLTTAWSDQAAATTCVTDIGFDYIGALLSASKLYNAGAGVGARLSMTFGDTTDLIKSKAWSNQSPLFDRLSQFKGNSVGADPHHAGTVRTLLRFAAALDTRQLISAEDSERMLSLLRPLRWATGEHGIGMPSVGLDHHIMKDERGYILYLDGVSSFILHTIDAAADVPLAFADPSKPFIDAAAKIGILGRRLADFGIVNMQTSDGHTIHWGIGFLNNYSRTSKEEDRADFMTNQYGRILRKALTEWIK